MNNVSKPYVQPGGPSWRDKFNDALHALEQKGANLLGVNEILDYAGSAPAALGYKGDNDGSGDALRHLILSAELYRTKPTLAPILLSGHEFGTNVLQGQSEESRKMDLYNNELGRAIGQQAKSRAEVEALAKQALSKAMIIDRSADATHSFSQGFQEEKAKLAP